MSNQGPQEAFEWVCNHLVTYADDLLCKWWIRSARDFEQVAHQIGEIFDIIESLGLVMTAVLCRSEGKGNKWLIVPRSQGQTWVKLVICVLGCQTVFLLL